MASDGYKGIAVNRLTVESNIIEGHYTLQCMCGFGWDGVPDDEDACYEYCERWDEGVKQCEQCGIQQAFDKLAAYEDSGLSPEEIMTLQADNARLHELVDIIERTIKAL